ncbi:MAG TPA: site-specific integrase, partial [Stellaceae bacterium]|nr:site-specific integrase [Stellaceae bacterium]
MASVRKRTWVSGGETRTKWIIDYFDQDRKRHIETFATKREAEAYKTDVLHEVNEGTHTAPHSSITVGEAGDLWLEATKLNGRERSTIKQYELNLRHHIKPLIGNVKLSALTTPRVQAFATDLIQRKCADGSEQTLSRAMARKVLGSLKSIIKHAQVIGKVAKNAAAPVSIKVPKRGTVKIRAGRDFPTKQEINAMLSKVSGHWRPLFLTAVFTGMRSSELRGLKWDDIDLSAKVIHVRQRADAWNALGAPKTEAGERDIPLAPMVVAALKEW